MALKASLDSQSCKTRIRTSYCHSRSLFFMNHDRLDDPVKFIVQSKLPEETH
jgi:hypothetical protein